MEARRRAIPAIVGLVGFTALGSIANPTFWSQWWFYVGLGIAVSATLIEPFFTRPQDALVNAVGGIAAFATAKKAGVEQLWWIFLGIATFVGISAAYAVMSVAPTRLKTVANIVSRRLGRAAFIGAGALSIEVVREAAHSEAGYQYLAIATVILTLSVVPNWHELLTTVRTRLQLPSAITAANAPAMLLLTSSDPSLQPGAAVRIVTDLGEAAGYILGRLAASDGLRYEVALSREWTTICRTFPTLAVLAVDDSDAARSVGVVLAGSTDLSLEFRPFQRPSVGDPLILVSPEPLLYQVSEVSLRREVASGASTLSSRASARQVGLVENGFIRSRPCLPDPHQILKSATDLTAALPEGYSEIGTIKGTSVPVGIYTEPAGRGHIAILGMSGMGKTAAAHRVCKAFCGNSVVIALDTTGEYRSRLGFPQWPADDFATYGYTVLEPAGEPTQRAADFIQKCMAEGNKEYAAGSAPKPRVVVLEEAHSFIPEWNFSSRSQQDLVSLSTRYIMQSRKFGITFVIVSQRTAVVSKSALSQCENYIVLRTIDQTSLDYMEAVVGAEQRHAIPSLRRFEAMCVGPAFNIDSPAIVSLLAPD